MVSVDFELDVVLRTQIPVIVKVARDSCDVTHSLTQASMHTSHVHGSKSCTKYELPASSAACTHIFSFSYRSTLLLACARTHTPLHVHPSHTHAHTIQYNATVGTWFFSSYSFAGFTLFNSLHFVQSTSRHTNAIMFYAVKCSLYLVGLQG